MTTTAYHRRPRVPVPAQPTGTVVIRTPPPAELSGRWALRLLQVAAPIAGAGTGVVVALAYRQSLALLLVMTAAVGVGVLVSAVTAGSQALAGRRRRLAARRRYPDYLAAEEASLDALMAAQEQRESLLFPTAGELLGLARERERVFECRPEVVVRGDPVAARGVARSLGSQLSVFHPPNDLGIAVLTENIATARAR